MSSGSLADVTTDPESTPAGLCVFFRPESRVTFVFGISWSLHGL